MSWYCALSLTFLSFSMSWALLSVTLCMLLTACCAVPLAEETAVVTLLMLVVVSLAACEIRPEPFSKAVLALEVKVLRPFCAVLMAVAVFARPLPALLRPAARRSLRRADALLRHVGERASRSSMVERMRLTFFWVLSSSAVVSLTKELVLPLMVSFAEFTALVSTSLTVETKVLLTVRSTVVAP